MSQRDSGYLRKERDLYETPAWVTEALLPHIAWQTCIWEPAAGSGAMLDSLAKKCSELVVSDIEEPPWPDFVTLSGHRNFLVADVAHGQRAALSAIITNPPYELATEFCRHSLRLMEKCNGLVAMLLRTDFDHAKGRAFLFRDCPAFSKKIVLMKRITWFEPEPGCKGKSPSFNHAWYIWDWKHEGPPTIGYGP